MREDFFSGGLFQVIKSVLTALLCSVFFTAIFALLLRVCPMGNGGITIVTQVLKGLALILGVLLFVRERKGLVKGGIVGLLFAMLGYLTFAALGGGLDLSWLILAELLLFATVGGLSGLVAVNVKKG